jgi:hypothetical protein
MGKQLISVITYVVSRVHRGLFCNLQSWARTHAVLVIGLYVSDNAYQLLAHGRYFSPANLVSSTTKTDRHDIAKILLKVALNTKNQIKPNHGGDRTTFAVMTST